MPRSLAHKNYGNLLRSNRELIQLYVFSHTKLHLLCLFYEMTDLYRYQLFNLMDAN